MTADSSDTGGAGRKPTWDADAVKEALEQAIEEAREFRRESSSRIVVPDVGGMGGPGPLPGGGKIKL